MNRFYEIAKDPQKKGIARNDDVISVISEWSKNILFHNEKGLVPLFITGVGASKSAQTPDKKSIPDVTQIINRLKTDFENAYKEDLEKHEPLSTYLTAFHPDKKDRSLVAKIFHAFQTDERYKLIWKQLNKEVLEIILHTISNPFYVTLADLYENNDAICLTLNFDGLLLRELSGKERKKQIFSLPTKEECELFFLRDNYKTSVADSDRQREYLEIQLRGDILYLKCDNIDFCPQKGKPPIPFANPVKFSDEKTNIKNIVKCPSCGKEMIPFLSFPGFYEKEKEMREMLEVVWKYLAHRIGSVTVVGVSGEWDPLIIAFLGDLLTEREIPLLIVEKDISNHPTPIIQELVSPQIHTAIAIETSADEFARKLAIGEEIKKPKTDFTKKEINDNFWSGKCDSTNWRKYKILEGSDLEYLFTETIEFKNLKHCAQLGLKSRWLPGGDPNGYHNRRNHSLGVMKIASYLYDCAVDNSIQSGNENFQKSDKEKQFLRLAALLHDIGHLPFSHLMEEVFEDLNWAPGYYLPNYSHGYYTEKQVKKIFKDNPQLADKFENIGYSMRDLIRLINGDYGVGYLDALINSAIDADKIDYIFRDTLSTRTNISLDPLKFLEEIGSDIHITPEKFLAFSGKSAKAMYELLKTRRALYENLYQPPAFSILDSITKHIITTYFIYLFDDIAVWEKIKNYRLIDDKEQSITDLGSFKVHYCIDKIDEMRNEYSNLPESHEDVKDRGLEFYILSKMIEALRFKQLNKNYLEGLEKGFALILSLIDDVFDSEYKLKKGGKIRAIESKIEIRSYATNELLTKIRTIAKTCKLRMPGILIIDIVKDRTYLSMASSRLKKIRSDDTETFSECILVPKGNPENWQINHRPEIALSESELMAKERKGFKVFIYSLSDDSEADHAKNLFRRLLQQADIPIDID